MQESLSLLVRHARALQDPAGFVTLLEHATVGPSSCWVSLAVARPSVRHASSPSLLRDTGMHEPGKLYAGTQWHFRSGAAWCAAHTCVPPCGDACWELALHPHARPTRAPARLGGRLVRPPHKLLDIFRLARVAACAGGPYSLRGGARSACEGCAGRRATCFSLRLWHVQAAVGQTAQYTSSLEHSRS